MNFDVVMLRAIIPCEKEINRLNKESKALALGSFNAIGWECGAMRQIENISNVIAERDALYNLLLVVKKGLGKIPRLYYKLIHAVYIKGIPKGKICSQFHISQATLYRRLEDAQKSFQTALIKLGFDDKWFRENYDHIEWIHKLLARKTGGARIST